MFYNGQRSKIHHCYLDIFQRDLVWASFAVCSYNILYANIILWIEVILSLCGSLLDESYILETRAKVWAVLFAGFVVISSDFHYSKNLFLLIKNF